MPVYEYRCEAGHRFEVTQRIQRYRDHHVSSLRPAGFQADFGTGDHVQGIWLVHHGLFE